MLLKMWTKGRPFPENAVFFWKNKEGDEEEVELANYDDDVSDDNCVIRIKRLNGLDSIKVAKISDLVVGVPTE